MLLPSSRAIPSGSCSARMSPSVSHCCRTKILSARLTGTKPSRSPPASRIALSISPSQNPSNWRQASRTRSCTESSLVSAGSPANFSPSVWAGCKYPVMPRVMVCMTFPSLLARSTPHARTCSLRVVGMLRMPDSLHGIPACGACLPRVQVPDVPAAPVPAVAVKTTPTPPAKPPPLSAPE